MFLKYLGTNMKKYLIFILFKKIGDGKIIDHESGHFTIVLKRDLNFVNKN